MAVLDSRRRSSIETGHLDEKRARRTSGVFTIAVRYGLGIVGIPEVGRNGVRGNCNASGICRHRVSITFRRHSLTAADRQSTLPSEAIVDRHGACDFHQTAINGPKLTQKKRLTVRTRESQQIDSFERIVRIRFAVLGWRVDYELPAPFCRRGDAKKRFFLCTPRVHRSTVFVIFSPFLPVSPNQ